MRRLALLPLVMLVFACNDTTLVQPEGDADLQISAKMGRNPHNPFVGVWWGIDVEAPPGCTTPGSNSRPCDTHNVTIGHENAHGVMPVNLRDSYTNFCPSNGWTRSRQMIGQIVDTNVLELSHLHFYCEDGTFLNFDLFGLPPFGYVYQPETDTLCYTFFDDLPETFCEPTLYRKKPW